MKEIELMVKVRACPNAVQILGVFDNEEDGIIPNKKHKYRYPVIMIIIIILTRLQRMSEITKIYT